MNHWYEQDLINHYRHSPYKGELEHYSFASQAYNPSCGDSISFQVLVKDDLITAIRFQGVGCVISQAAASLLCEQVCGKPLSVVMNISSDDMLALIKIPLGPTRSRCAFLALEALQSGMREELKDNVRSD